MDNNNNTATHTAGTANANPDRIIIIALSALVLLATFGYGWLGFTLTFQSNDDPAMLGIASGIFSVDGGSPRLVFQSAFLGKLYQSLFALWPGFDSYSALQLLVNALSLWCIAYTILRINSNLLVLLSLLVVGTVYLAPMIFFIQFTHTSMLCVIASCTLLLRQAFSEKLSISVWLLAAVLAIFAIAMRSANLMVVLCVIAIVAGIRVLVALSSGHGLGAAGLLPVAKKWLALLVFALACVFASKGLQQAEQRIFYSEPEWQAFWEGHSNRAYVLENWPKWLSADQLVAAFHAEADLTPSEYLLLRAWLPIDNQVYSLAGFAQLADITRALAGESPGIADRLLEANRMMIETSMKEPILLSSGAVLLLLGIIHSTRNSRQASAQLLNVMAWALAGYAILMGIILLYRFPPFRVTLSITTLCMVGAIACQAYISARFATAQQQQPRSNPTANLLCCGALLAGVLALNLHGFFLTYSDNVWKMREQRCALADQELQALEAIPGQGTIFLSPGLIDSTCYIKPFDHQYPAILQQRAIAFGWRNLTPWVQHRLFAEHDNLFDAICASKDNTFATSYRSHPQIAQYLLEHKPEYTFRYKAEGTGSPNQLECVRLTEPGPATGE